MTGRILTVGGEEYDLPVLLGWRLRRTGGVPCDSFEVKCLYSAEMAEVLRMAHRFTALEDGATAFYGVVDEWRAVCGGEGLTLEIGGRGMAALLLDNETEAATYQCASMSELLREHVRPYGIVCREECGGALTGEYAVASGSSRWKAVNDFAARCGLVPYFTKEGALCVRGESAGGRHTLTDSAAVLRAEYRERRYGVLSEVTVVNRSKKLRETVRNEAFRTLGGCRRQVIYTPSRSANELRYTGRYQIAQSERGARELTVMLAGRWEIDARDYVTLAHGRLGISGSFRVAEAVRELSVQGETTALTLWEE